MGHRLKLHQDQTIVERTKMKSFLTTQKITPFSKTYFPVFPVTWYLNYLLHQMVFTESKVVSHYDNIKFKDLNFGFSKTSPEKILTILKGLNSSKAAGIDNLSGKFLKDGADIVARPISQLCNLSVKLSSFPRSCKTANITKP